MGNLSEKNRQILHVMGIRTWQEYSTVKRKAASRPKVAHPAARDTAGAPVSQPQPVQLPNPVAPDVSRHNWAGLRKAVADCRLCELCTTRTQTVFGVGSESANWMFIGEAPGADEDRRGEPFVGRAGQLLDAMLMSVGLDRKSAYITNVVKCRPPGNRDPKTDEMQLCGHYLERQIELLQPKLIVAVGRVAAQRLLATTDTLARLRSKVHHYGEKKVPVIVTYHPAYLLRSPGQKRKAWEDLLQGVRTIESNAT